MTRNRSTEPADHGADPDAEATGPDGTGRRDPVATVESVTCALGGTEIVTDVSFRIFPGVTAIIGPNGSGKSTLLRAIVGEIEPVSGQVRRDSEGGVRPIGYLPQRTSFRSSFTARETLSFYTNLVGESAGAALERVGLADAADRPIDGLSGGMRRLVGLAQATTGGPALVALDEPTGGLDPGMADHVFGLIGSMARDGRAVVLASHDLHRLDAVADRVVVLEGGRHRTTHVREPTDGAGSSVKAVYRENVSSSEGRVHVTGVTDR